MKNLALLSVVFALAMACSKNDPAPVALQNTKVTTTTITPPTVLTSSTDVHAQAVVEYINSANSLTQWTSYFGTTPAGATKSSTTIKASNGRVNNALGTTVTYTWTDTQSGNMVAYQVTDDGISYTWEFFYKTSGSNDWLKYLDANETKDGSKGYLRVLDFTGSDPSAVVYRFDWTKVGNTFTYKWTFGTDYYFNLTYDLTTKAGSINYYTGSTLTAKYTWDGTGHGTWQTLDSQGTITDSGTW